MQNRGNLVLSSAAGFAALFSLGIVFTTYNQIPGIDDPESLLTAFYADRADRIEVLVGGLLLVGASLLLLLFVSELARTWELRPLALAAATLSGAAVCAGAIALALVAGEMSLRGAAPPSPELERWLAELGYALILIPGMAAAALLVLVCSRAGASTGTLPSWLSRAGVAVACWLVAAVAIAIAGQTLWGVLPLPLWAVAAGATVSRR